MYGHDVEEVLDLVPEPQEQNGATLLVGNHNRMFAGARDVQRGRPGPTLTIPCTSRNSAPFVASMTFLTNTGSEGSGLRPWR
jgi:hypothetical protein